MKTLYELLGVDPDADEETLKAAYRKLAKMHHPDLNPDDTDAARRFRQVVSAIAILGDAKKRAAYDRRLLRELLRRLGGERERSRRGRAINAVAAVAMAVVFVKGAPPVEPVPPTLIVTRATTYGVAQRPDRPPIARPDSISPEWSNDTVQILASLASPPQRGPVSKSDEVAVRPEKPAEARPPGERELSASERAALVRQAQELRASGDAQGAQALLQRACRGLRQRCGPGVREEL